MPSRKSAKPPNNPAHSSKLVKGLTKEYDLLCRLDNGDRLLSLLHHPFGNRSQ